MSWKTGRLLHRGCEQMNQVHVEEADRLREQISKLEKEQAGQVTEAVCRALARARQEQLGEGPHLAALAAAAAVEPERVRELAQGWDEEKLRGSLAALALLVQALVERDSRSAAWQILAAMEQDARVRSAEQIAA